MVLMRQAYIVAYSIEALSKKKGISMVQITIAWSLAKEGELFPSSVPFRRVGSYRSDSANCGYHELEEP